MKIKDFFALSFISFSCLDSQGKTMRSKRLYESQSNSTSLERDTRNIDLPLENNLVPDDTISEEEHQSYSNLDDDDSFLQPKCEVSQRERINNPSTCVNSNMDISDTSSNPNSSFEDDLPLLDLCNKEKAVRERIQYSRPLQQPVNSQDLSEITSTSISRPALNNSVINISSRIRPRNRCG